jgi:hypothetical protein
MGEVWIVGKQGLTDFNNLRAFDTFERAFDFLVAYYPGKEGFLKLGECKTEYKDCFEYPVMVMDEFHDFSAGTYIYDWRESYDSFLIQRLELVSSNHEQPA